MLWPISVLPDSLGEGESLLLFLCAIIFIFLIIKISSEEGDYVTKVLLPACEPQIYKFKLFYHSLPCWNGRAPPGTGMLLRFRRGGGGRCGEGRWRLPSSRDVPTMETHPSSLEPRHRRNSSLILLNMHIFYIANLKWKHFYPYTQNCFCFISWHFTTH